MCADEPERADEQGAARQPHTGAPEENTTEESPDGTGRGNREQEENIMRGQLGNRLKGKEWNTAVSVLQPHQQARAPEPAAGAMGSEHGKTILIFGCGRVGSFFLLLSSGLTVKHKVNTFSKT